MGEDEIGEDEIGEDKISEDEMGEVQEDDIDVFTLFRESRDKTDISNGQSLTKRGKYMLKQC